MKPTLIVMMGPAGAGKAQPVNTIIPTPSGDKKLGDIEVGDYVFDRLGKQTKVLGVFPQGKIDTYKVTLTDGRETFCNEEHLWTCYTSKGNFKTLSLKEMMKQGIRENSKKTEKKGGCRFRIPRHESLEYSHKEYRVAPYIVGAFLGDGCCLEKPLTVSSVDYEIVSKINAYLPFDSYPKKNSERNYNWNFYFNSNKKLKNNSGLRYKAIQTSQLFSEEDLYTSVCCKSYEKRIPERYLYGDKQQRLELLRGLLDTDGSISKDSRGTIRFTSTSLGLVKDVRKLCISLGFEGRKVHEDERKKKYTKSCYTMIISVPPYYRSEVFSLSRKKKRGANSFKKNPNPRKNWKYIGIDRVEKMPFQTEMVCIYVENEEHLYLTNDCIVTHNTFLAEEIKKSHEDTIIVSRDKIRFALLQPEDDYFAVEPAVIRQYYYNINFALQSHAYVIADATHLSKGSRKQFFRNVKTDNVRVVGIWVEVPLDVALKQNGQRTGRACVPEEVIKQMYKSKLTPRDNEPFDEIIYVNPHEDMALGRVSTGITSVKEKLHLI